MKLKIRSTIRPCLVTTPSRSKTLIVGGTITHVNDEEWNHPYCAVVPGGVITLDDIEWECAGTPGGQHMQYTPEQEFVVNSATDCKVYTVRVTSHGTWTCTCPHFTYRKQICKHIKEWQ